MTESPRETKPVAARQGVTGHHVWVVLVAGLVLAGIAWFFLQVLVK